MKLEKFWRSALLSTLTITGEMVLIGLVLVVPCFVIFLPGSGERAEILNRELVILLMQLAGLCFLLLSRLRKLGRMIGGRVNRIFR